MFFYFILFIYMYLVTYTHIVDLQTWTSVDTSVLNKDPVNVLLCSNVRQGCKWLYDYNQCVQWAGQTLPVSSKSMTIWTRHQYVIAWEHWPDAHEFITRSAELGKTLRLECCVIKTEYVTRVHCIHM